MKTLKIYLLLLLIIVASCNNQEEMTERDKSTTLNDQIASIEKLLPNSEPLIELYNSIAWLNLSTEIKSKIDHSKDITITTYTHTTIKAIIFELKTNATYESLVFCKQDQNFIPVISKSETFSDAKIVTVSDLEGNQYYNVKADIYNKIIDVNTFKSFEISYSDSKINNPNAKEKTCPEKTTSGWACFKCAVNECADDNLCAFTCTLMAPHCSIGFMLACAIG